MIYLSQYKAFIFDMDGVIVNNHSYHLMAWKIFCDKYSFPFNINTFSQQYFGKSNFEILSELSDKKVTEMEALTLGEEKEIIYRELYAKEIMAHTGLLDLLKVLKSNDKLTAVASSAPISNINFVLDKLKIREYFNTLVDASMVKFSKPNPEIYLKASSALNIEPKECLVFEDSHSGIKAAQDAGMNVVVLATTHSKNELNYNLDIIDDFKELLHYEY
jgi:beta-phosphoglucomutase family hydrolase